MSNNCEILEFISKKREVLIKNSAESPVSKNWLFRDKELNGSWELDYKELFYPKNTYYIESYRIYKIKIEDKIYKVGDEICVGDKFYKITHFQVVVNKTELSSDNYDMMTIKDVVFEIYSGKTKLIQSDKV